MKTLVLYKSKSGFVEKYANWIGQSLNGDVYELDTFNMDNLMAYDTVIYGGGLYAVGINGLSKIIGKFDDVKYKNIILFASGASPFRPGILDEIIDKNLTDEQKSYIKTFYLRGGFEYEKLGFMDKRLMDLLKLKLKRKKNLTADERGMLAAYDTPIDFTRRENVEELVSYVNTLQNCECD